MTKERGVPPSRETQDQIPLSDEEVQRFVENNQEELLNIFGSDEAFSAGHTMISRVFTRDDRERLRFDDPRVREATKAMRARREIQRIAGMEEGRAIGIIEKLNSIMWQDGNFIREKPDLNGRVVKLLEELLAYLRIEK